jgi:hypothetical protein|tara:strand:+ start:86 stop:298 length:213 start_codon:yes stop_codon:yes gene_type:complete
MSKKLYWFYKATVIHSGAVCAESEEQAIEKVVKNSERLPEMVSFKPEEVRVRKLAKRPSGGLYHDSKYEW